MCHAHPFVVIIVNDYCKEIMEGDVADFNNCAADEEQEEEGAFLIARDRKDMKRRGLSQ